LFPLAHLVFVRSIFHGQHKNLSRLVSIEYINSSTSSDMSKAYKTRQVCATIYKCQARFSPPYLSTCERAPGFDRDQRAGHEKEQQCCEYAITHKLIWFLWTPLLPRFLLRTVFTQVQACPSPRESRSQEEEEPCRGACPRASPAAAAGTSRPALGGHGLEVLVEPAALFVAAGICSQCEPGSSTCPGSSISSISKRVRTPQDTEQRNVAVVTMTEHQHSIEIEQNWLVL
jgi:hypothetical protein